MGWFVFGFLLGICGSAYATNDKVRAKVNGCVKRFFSKTKSQG